MSVIDVCTPEEEEAFQAIEARQTEACSKRADGWYWVKLEDSNGWIPWEWRSSSRSPEGFWYNSENPVETGPRIPTPDEPWQCVPAEDTPEITTASVDFTNGKRTHHSRWQQMLSAAPKPEDVCKSPG